MNAATLAGVISTLLFLGSNLPMVVRAARTRGLTSYSRGNLVMTNIGNAWYTVYVLSLPAGPTGCCTSSTPRSPPSCSSSTCAGLPASLRRGTSGCRSD